MMFKDLQAIVPELESKNYLPDKNFLYEMMRYNPLYSDFFAPAKEKEPSEEG